MARDISQKVFDRKVQERGFRALGFMGYYALPEPFENHNVSVYNAADNNRARLAYLLKELQKAQNEAAQNRH